MRADQLNALTLQLIVAQSVKPVQPSLTEQALQRLNAQGTQYGSIPPGFCAGHPQDARGAQWISLK